jgi:hypothetical protein
MVTTTGLREKKFLIVDHEMEDSDLLEEAVASAKSQNVCYYASVGRRRKNIRIFRSSSTFLSS